MMETLMYTLPSYERVRCLDRFSILPDGTEGGDGLVPFWNIVVAVLDDRVESTSDVIGILDTISICLRGSSGSAGDYGTLKLSIEKIGPDFFSKTWPRIVQASLMMPDLFASGRIDTLAPCKATYQLRLSRQQVACLVAHQFLCTLAPPSSRNDFYDFSIWYHSSQRHPKAVEMYLTALFTYFEGLDLSSNAGDGVEYTLYTAEIPSKIAEQEQVPLASAIVLNLVEYTTEQQQLSYQGSHGAVVISANKDIGFGQSATQEELYVGNCPEACPVVLVTPTLRHNEILMVNGARPMLCILGQRRDIQYSILESSLRKGGRMLFMDALEIDELDTRDGHLPDLDIKNIDRELAKAYSAFSAWPSDENATIWSGIWGCGAFNGDPGVKMCILWMAASLAGKKLQIICDGYYEEFSNIFGHFIELVGDGTVEGLRKRLEGVPMATKRLDTMRVLMECS